MFIFSPLKDMLHFGKNHDKNLSLVLTIIMMLSSKHFVEKRLKSGVNVICVPVFVVGVSSFISIEERLFAQRILILPCPSHVTHSNDVEKMFVPFIPTPFKPIVPRFLSSSKFDPDIGLHTALTHIHSPASFFFTGIPLPLSSIEHVSLVIVTDILLAYFQSVFRPSSTELSIASFTVLSKPSTYLTFL